MEEKKKYIVFTDGSARIFSADSIHAYMTGGKDALSAGFVMVAIDGLPTEVFGESTTLGVKSRVEDLEILQALPRI